MGGTTAPNLGIVVPAWNAGALLGDTIRELLAALDGTGVEADILVVDDGSTDDTAEVARSFDDSRVELVRVEHGGVSAARNAGLAHLRNRIVTMLDTDDRFTSALLTDLLPRAVRRDAPPIVQGLVQDWYADDGPGAQGSAKRSPYRSINLGAALYDAEVFRTVGLFDAGYTRHEDYDWYLRAYDLRVPKENVEVVSLRYCRRADGLSRTSLAGDPTLARIHGAAIRRRRAGLAPMPAGFPEPGTYFGTPPKA